MTTTIFNSLDQYNYNYDTQNRINSSSNTNSAANSPQIRNVDKLANLASRTILHTKLSTSSTNAAAVAKGLALENSVTGTNYPRNERDKQAEEFKSKDDASKLPKSRTDLELKHLYFIALPDFEGELAVGIGRVVKRVMTGEIVTKGEGEWLARRGWSSEPTSDSFRWAKSPMFDAYMVAGKVARNEHPISDFLPVDVELTEGSTHDKTSGLSSKKQRFCVVAKCVARLRHFCEYVRPDLINLQAAESSDGVKRPRRSE